MQVHLRWADKSNVKSGGQECPPYTRLALRSA